MADEIGRVLGGRYRLLSPLGAGASAQVYLADDVRLRRRVAVKILHAGLAGDESFLRRFRAEAQAAAALSHPHIVAVYDWSGDEATPYLVTEYLSGGSLRSVLDGGHRLTPSQALVVGLEAARALDHAHRQGFVHRDIKPANLIFGADARLRIADFGLARALAEAAWTEPQGAVLGTARYASPEQARGEPVDGRSDVYSLALLLVEGVTGSVPFTADTTIGMLMARLDQPLQAPEEMGPLGAIIQAAGTLDPAERLDAAAFGQALVKAAEELPRPTPIPLTGPSQTAPIKGDPADVTLVGHLPLPPPPVAAPGGPAGRGSAIPPPPGIPGAPGGTLLAGAALATAATMGPGGAAGALSGANGGLGTPGAPGLATAAGAGPTSAAAFGAGNSAGNGAGLGAGVGAPSSNGLPPPGASRFAPATGLAGAPGDRLPPPPPGGDRVQPPEFSPLKSAAPPPRRWVTVLVVVAAVAVGAVGALLVQRSSVPSHPVPAGLVGRPFDEINDHVGEFGWRIEPTDERKDGTEPGEILSTDPAAGEDLKEGGTLRVVRSLGPTLVTVPTDLVGKTREEAEAALTAPGVELSPQVEEKADEEVDEGRVISVGDGSAQLPKGSPIPLVVSSGPPNEVVPDVIGLELDEAREALEDLGLDVETDVDRSADGDRNEVVDVEPGEGEEVEAGETVTLVLAQGRAFSMPDLSGMTLDDAREKLEDEGLEAGNVAGPGDGKVLGTLPLAGTPVVAGTQVQILMR
jgi:eukaryotic-like serine/threonine-protein kinase